MSLVICLHYQTSPHSIKMILYFRNRLSGTANRKQQQSRQTESCVLSQQIFDGFTPNLLPVLGTLFWGCRKFLLGHLTCLATPLLLAAIFIIGPLVNTGLAWLPISQSEGSYCRCHIINIINCCSAGGKYAARMCCISEFVIDTLVYLRNPWRCTYPNYVHLNWHSFTFSSWLGKRATD